MPRHSRWPAHILLLATVAALLGGPATARLAALAADRHGGWPARPPADRLGAGHRAGLTASQVRNW
jgi:hypothetical protein